MLTFRQKSFRSVALLAGLGGIIGGSQAVLGLLLGAGGIRFALAFVIIGGLVLMVSRRFAEPSVVGGVKLAGRVGMLGLALAIGAGGGLIWLGRGEVSPSPVIPVAGWMVLAAILSGACAGAWTGLDLDRRWRAPGLGVAVIVGVAAGAALGRFVDWPTGKFAVWGVTSGAVLTAALSGLLRPGPERSQAASGRRLVKGYLFLLFFLVLINSAMPAAWDDTGTFNLYSYQANALLHGRLDVEPPSALDVAQYGGRRYVPFPPLPAIVLLPIAWAQGAPAVPSLPMSLISAALTALSAVLLDGILEKLEVRRRRRYWVLAAFVFGTGLWMALLGADSSHTFFAHVVAVPCLLLALRESVGKGRGVLAGLFLGLAFLSRQMTIVAIIFVAALLVERADYRSLPLKRLNVLGAACGLGICVIVYFIFNQLRFENPLDTGYAFINYSGYQQARLQQFGLFDLAYLPSNFYYTFLQGFHIEFEGPALLNPLRMDPYGTSLTIASPFLFLAVFGRWNRRLVLAAWASVLLILCAQLLYFTNGWIQYNTQRYSLDYVPVVIVLVGLAAKRIRPNLLEGLVLYSIGLNLIALFIISWTRIR